jgi:hypothetical protein
MTSREAGMGNEGMAASRPRALALAIAVVGLALTAYVELGMTASGAPDPIGWFLYGSVAWLALLAFGPMLPVPVTVLAGALLALALEAVAYWLVFGVPDGAANAAIYLWKPLAQLAMIAASWLAGYLVYLRSLRARADG